MTEKRNSHASEAVPDHPTGAVIALLTRDDGILVDAFDHAGYTALHVAASASDASAVAALCTAGARFDIRASNDDDDGEKGSIFLDVKSYRVLTLAWQILLQIRVQPLTKRWRLQLPRLAAQDCCCQN